MGIATAIIISIATWCQHGNDAFNTRICKQKVLACHMSSGFGGSDSRVQDKCLNEGLKQ